MSTDVWLTDAGGQRRPDTLDRPIGSIGSQGSVWHLRDAPDTVAKVVHRGDPDHLAARLRAMLEAPADWSVRAGLAGVAWPIATVCRRDDNRLIGYAAPKIGPPRFAPLPLLLNPSVRARMLPGATWDWWLALAEDLARTVDLVHRHGHVIGDLAPANLFATGSGRVCFIDADGWQVHDARTGDDLLCPFSRPEYTAPEELDGGVRRRAPESDSWALATIVVQLMCLGFHPFGGVPAAADDPVSEVDNLRQRRSWLLGADLRTPAAAPPRTVLPPLVRRRLEEAFDAGYDDPWRRPRPLDWAAVLAHTRRGLVTCTAQPTHVYTPGADGCPWCAVVGRGARDPFPVVAYESVPGRSRR
jgi:DNA-binding helix-hairpin-helix protein with protein kinase domain